MCASRNNQTAASGSHLTIDPNDAYSDRETYAILHALLTQFSHREIFTPNEAFTISLATSPSRKRTVHIRLSSYIVKYQEKTPHLARRSSYIITGKFLGKGTQGAVFESSKSLILSDNRLTIKEKHNGKKRIFKLEIRKAEIQINSNTKRTLTEHEAFMLSRLPDLFHAKPLIEDYINDKRGTISRLFEGEELYDMIVDDTLDGMTDAQKLNLCIELVKSLHAIHAKNVIHRDIKPENIIVDIDPRTHSIRSVKLVDVGLSITVSDANVGGGSAAGTAYYVPPETWNGQHPAITSDIFTLGRVFWVLLSGMTIEEFIHDFSDTTATKLPDKHHIFRFQNRSETYPAYADDMYSLLARMNDHNPLTRISLNAVFVELTDIQSKLRAHIATHPAKTTPSAAEAAAMPANADAGLRLFSKPVKSDPERTNMAMSFTPRCLSADNVKIAIGKGH